MVYSTHAINQAASSGNLDLVKYLIDLGIPLSIEAITNSALYGKFKCFQFLYNTNRFKLYGYGSLDLSNLVIRGDNVDIFKLIYNKNDLYNYVHIIARHDKVNILEYLLDNTTSSFGYLKKMCLEEKVLTFLYNKIHIHEFRDIVAHSLSHHVTKDNHTWLENILYQFPDGININTSIELAFNQGSLECLRSICYYYTNDDYKLVKKIKKNIKNKIGVDNLLEELKQKDLLRYSKRYLELYQLDHK